MPTINNITVNLTQKYQKYTQEVKTWNEVMQNAPGKDDEETIGKIIRQSKFLIEEATEVKDGAELYNVREILDGHLDTRFVNDQIGVYLESLGVDLEGAWSEVCRSNDSKFSTDLEMMHKSQAYYFEHANILTVVVESPIKGTYVLKNVDTGKIMKPLCFKEPDLRPFIPKHLLVD